MGWTYSSYVICGPGVRWGHALPTHPATASPESQQVSTRLFLLFQFPQADSHLSLEGCVCGGGGDGASRKPLNLRRTSPMTQGIRADFCPLEVK